MWNQAAARHLGSGDIIRPTVDGPVLAVVAVTSTAAGIVIDLADLDSGTAADRLHALPHDEYSRSEPVRFTVTPEAAEFLNAIVDHEQTQERLQAGPVSLSLREAQEAIDVLEAALERPGPGSAAPVDAIDDDTQRSCTRGSLAGLWDELCQAAASAETLDIEGLEADGLGW